jgi:hypothetical protein
MPASGDRLACSSSHVADEEGQAEEELAEVVERLGDGGEGTRIIRKI